MTDWHTWLPAACLTGEPAIAPFAAAVDAWSEHWFETPPLAIASKWVTTRPSGLDVRDWEALHTAAAGGLGLQIRREGSEYLVAALLGSHAARPAYTAHDRKLFDPVAAHVLGDLRERLVGVVKTLDVSAGSSGPSFELGLLDGMGRPILRLLADCRLLVALVKSHTAPRHAPPPPVSARADAIDDTVVTAALRAGCARLSYSDLAGLAAGDVLILDRQHEQRFDLLVDDQVVAPGAASIVPAGIHNPIEA